MRWAKTVGANWNTYAAQLIRDGDREHWRIPARDGPTDGPFDTIRTLLTTSLKSGANPKVVQQMLGHASAAMTLDVYADLFDADLDDVADRLDEAASRAAGVSQVCPGDGPEGGDEMVGEGGDDDDDGLGGAPALVS